jgi:hypothetical protein
MSKEFNLLNYEYCKKILTKKKLVLLKMDKSATNYQKRLKSYFKLLIFVKAHAFALDTELERRKLLNIFMEEIQDLKMY